MTRKYRILCVDDRKDILELIKVMLEKEGYDVSVSESGEDALRQISVEVPDLILLDIMMPIMPGLEVLKKIISGDKTRNVPVIMLTAINEFSYIKTAMELGASTYISKPFNRVMLLGLIHGFISQGPGGESANV